MLTVNLGQGFTLSTSRTTKTVHHQQNTRNHMTNGAGAVFLSTLFFTLIAVSSLLARLTHLLQFRLFDKTQCHKYRTPIVSSHFLIDCFTHLQHLSINCVSRRPAASQ